MNCQDDPGVDRLPQSATRSRWHDLLLAFAGFAEDGALAAARAAQDDDIRTIRLLSGIEVVASGLTPADLQMLLQMAADRPGEPAMLAAVLASRLPPVTAEFRMVWPVPCEAGEAVNNCGSDPVVVALCSGSWLSSAVEGLWGAVRAAPAPGTLRPRVDRLYLVQVGEPNLLPVVTVQLQEILASAGETAPRVEVFATGDWLPDYHRSALTAAHLLWRPAPVDFASCAG